MTVGVLDRELMQGRLYGRTGQHRAQLDFARDGIETFLGLCERVYLSLSFGKQSIVLAHMVHRIAPDIPMFFLASSESYIIHDYIDVIDRFMQLAPVRLTIVQTNNAALEISRSVAELSRRQPSIRWIHRPPGDPGWTWQETRAAGHWDLQTMVDRNDYDGWLWGLATDESVGRRFTLLKRWPGQPHRAIFRYSDSKYRCCPLMNWKPLDLAAYIAAHDLPLLDTYHQAGLAARTTARITARSAEEGAMTLFAHGNLPAFNVLAARFPELRMYR